MKTYIHVHIEFHVVAARCTQQLPLMLCNFLWLNKSAICCNGFCYDIQYKIVYKIVLCYAHVL